VKPADKPYTVFTPYMRKWKEKFHESGGLGELLNKEEPTANWHPDKGFLPSLEQIGFTDNGTIEFPEIQIDPEQLQQYHKTRDFPGLEGTTKLGVHLRFGTVSIRKLVDYALANNETFLNELIWREFYMMILWHFPQVVTESFRPAYDRIPWRNETADFDLWCQGNTGFPMVDAGMRELNATGYMHNRVRMVVASFLTKHLLIDWRWGEAYFAEKLLDFELASNNGGWQWAAGCGCDAAPYFRVFNPSLQAKKFDPDSEYINKWVPEWNSEDYQQPMVNHSFARKRAIETYKGALTEF
ncbi:MAG: DNA photolyase family protein, partial [Cyclobacteriaceae bacterium]|nr:DNA photolyase family protein [Cyclobacteriaceae bacterium]